MKKNHQSDLLWERALKVIPLGTQTLSKAPDQFVRGVTPKYLKRGIGSHVFDIDGGEYIDYPMALGPIILGYAYERVQKAVQEQLKDGTTFTLMHPLEVELAELLIEVIPVAEMVRFGKNGADATSAAIRAARAYTGREHVAYCGYHGYQDWYACIHPKDKGVPQSLKKLMHAFKYNDIESLKRVFDEFPHQIAAVIMEQPGTEPQDNFLQQAIDLAHKNGAVFILDEIVTGFRYALGGAQQYYQIKPDLSCFGKGMANGFPISAVVGKKEIMKEFEEIFFSTTYGGETLSMAAALATIKEIREKDVISYIWEKGKRLREGILKAADEVGIDFSLEGNPVRSGFVFRDEKKEASLAIKSLFLQETVKRGILFGGPVFITFSHTDEDITKTIEASLEGFKVVKKAVEAGDIDRFMEGEKIGYIFRTRN